MSENIDYIHDEIEIIYQEAVDHIHADVLHKFVDDQQAIIQSLNKEIEELRVLAEKYIHG